MFDIRAARDEKAILANIKHDPNFRPPSWWSQEPLIVPQLDWLLGAYHELSTERQIGWQCGPIPVSRIREAGERILGSDSVMIQPFMAIIRVLDAAFLEYSEQQREKEQKRNARASEGPKNRASRFRRR